MAGRSSMATVRVEFTLDGSALYFSRSDCKRQRCLLYILCTNSYSHVLYFIQVWPLKLNGAQTDCVLLMTTGRLTAQKDLTTLVRWAHLLADLIHKVYSIFICLFVSLSGPLSIHLAIYMKFTQSRNMSASFKSCLLSAALSTFTQRCSL